MTAKALAANGAKVYITGRRAEKLKEAEMQHSESGGQIIGIQADVTDKDSIKSVVKAISEKEKYVNLLVNNAGVTSKNFGEKGFPKGSPEDVSQSLWEYQDFNDWTSIYSINVAAIYFVSVAFIPLLCAARDHGYPEAGNVLNISSLSGITKTSQNGQYSYNGELLDLYTWCFLRTNAKGSRKSSDHLPNRTASSRSRTTQRRHPSQHTGTRLLPI